MNQNEKEKVFKENHRAQFSEQYLLFIPTILNNTNIQQQWIQTLLSDIDSL